MFRPIILGLLVCCFGVNVYAITKCEDGKKEGKIEIDCDFNIEVKEKDECVCDLLKKQVKGPDGKCIPKDECEKKPTEPPKETKPPKDEDGDKYCGENEELQPLYYPRQPSYPYGGYPGYGYRHNYNKNPCDSCGYKKCYSCACKKGYVSKGEKCYKGKPYGK